MSYHYDPIINIHVLVLSHVHPRDSAMDIALQFNIEPSIVAAIVAAITLCLIARRMLSTR